MQGLLVYDMPLDEGKDPLNAPFLQALPVINLSSDETRSPNNKFWNDVFEEWASDSVSSGYVDPNDDLLLKEDVAAVHFSENGQYKPLSPINSLNSIEEIETKNPASGANRYKMAGTRHDPLNFFKVMFGVTWQDHMDLPPLFVIRSNASVENVLTIHTSRGATAFRLVQSNDGLLALSGPEWADFVSANNIHETYILLFMHQGNMHFNMNIFDQTAIPIESEEDNAENEDSSDDNEEANDVIDVGDYDAHEDEDDVEVNKIFRITVPPSSGYNYHHSCLARLTIPFHALMSYNLLEFTLANLKVPAAGTRTWSVNMKWITCHDQSGTEGRQSFAPKERWLEFANPNRIRGGDVCVFEMREEVGNIVNMDVVIERRGRVHRHG
ncbi:hypothetical protein BUALT_Bualt08G0075500 [Buddleja alternifolia]|uniref:TF-B3 domain-containing protein n=1 Tax=Buddleja alternifolia TaxID=168488 RepID=A0AAV6X4X1_9LAMI|nr:hypothetical protein BUALT_Bualt08G0075500 [Buddleja alternifolia]